MGLGCSLIKRVKQGAFMSIGLQGMKSSQCVKVPKNTGACVCVIVYMSTDVASGPQLQLHIRSVSHSRLFICGIDSVVASGISVCLDNNGLIRFHILTYTYTHTHTHAHILTHSSCSNYWRLTFFFSLRRPNIKNKNLPNCIWFDFPKIPHVKVSGFGK